MLEVARFGEFQQRIRDAFEQLFGFPFEPMGEESDEVVECRAAVRRVARYDGQATVDEKDADAWGLICAAEKLRGRIASFVQPVVPVLTALDRVEKCCSRLEARLLVASEASAEAAGNVGAEACAKRLVEIRSSVPEQLRKVRGAVSSGEPCDLGAVVADAVRDMRLAIDGVSPAAPKGRGNTPADVLSLLDELSEELEQLRLTAEGLPSTLGLPYLLRLVRELEIRTEARAEYQPGSLGDDLAECAATVNALAAEMARDPLARAAGVPAELEAVAERARWYGAVPESGRMHREVPDGFLRSERNRREARTQAIKELVLHCPGAWHLVSSAARGNQLGTFPGGKGRRNPLHDGIAAALVLHGLIGEGEFTQSRNPEKRFAYIVKAVKDALLRLGRDRQLELTVAPGEVNVSLAGGAAMVADTDRLASNPSSKLGSRSR